LFRQHGDFGVGKIGKIQVSLLILHKIKIEALMMTLVTGVVAENGESTDESGRVSRSIQAKRLHNDAVTTSPTLHEKVTVPLFGHCEGEGDSKLLAANSGTAIHYSFDSTVGGKRRSPTLRPRYFFGRSGSNGNGFRDFDVWGFELH
jgi:hypothetical protein